ncbi:MAG: hypothetical protein IJL37_05410 [Bacteroidaceae bacterium]|nr:hypothetical protein [Bacteroidaceae bacterium]
MSKKFVTLERVSLPLDEIELKDDELLFITGGATMDGTGAGCGCGCECSLGKGCGCGCGCGNGTGTGCGCGCECGITPPPFE